jgi:hypothetical protein
VAFGMSDRYHEELRRQQEQQKQLEETMQHQENQKQRDEQLKIQLEWLNRQ